MKMSIKRVLSMFTIAAIGATMISGCSSTAQGAADKTVTIWASGSDNVKIQFEKQIAMFNEVNEGGYVAELQFITSGTGTQSLADRLIAAHQAGQKNTDYDLIEVGNTEIVGYMTQGGEDMFLPIDETKVKNLENLTVSSSAAERPDLFIPYRGTTVLLAYNSETVENPPKTAQELYQWIKENPGRFAYNTPGSGGAGSSFVVTSVYNFLDASALTKTDEGIMTQWEQGFELMEELHPFMYQSSGKVVYPNKNQGTLDLLASKEIDMTPAWADMVISQQAQGTIPEEIKLTQIDPAFTGGTVSLGVPSMGSNPEGAQAFIDYMLTPEAQNIALESMAALPVVDFSTLKPELVKSIEGLNIEAFRSSSIGGLSTILNEKWDAEIGTLD